MKTILSIQNLGISFGHQKALFNSSFTVQEKETVGIVGESGSGKSLSALALMGLLPKTAKISDSSVVLLEGKNLLGEQQLHRGKGVSMIFQEPMTSLNPVFTCGEQVVEGLMLHQKLTHQEAKKQTINLFEKVKLPSPISVFDKYPHQLSGGQKQRIMIAMAISLKPKVLIADEPTTALDVTVQKDILSLLQELKEEIGMSMIFITHDLSLVSTIADKILVMKNGEIVEQGDNRAVFTAPEHPYTKALLACRPPLNKRYEKLPTVADFLKQNNQSTGGPTLISDAQRAAKHKVLYQQDPVLKIKELSVSFVAKKNWLGKTTAEHQAVRQISFDLYQGESLGLVGESGCGKTSTGRAIVKLIPTNNGTIHYQGKNILDFSKVEDIAYRKKVQIIFQDPYSSLNPRKQIGSAIVEVMKVHRIAETKKERIKKTIDLLLKVGLQEEDFFRYPHEFSGGQRQRVSIARTLAVEPEIIICDESVSALDVSIQAQILNLLHELKKEFDLSYLFISHDLSVVKHFCDRVLVMNKNGEIEEEGESDFLYLNPKKEYTQTLISAIPKMVH